MFAGASLSTSDYYHKRKGGDGKGMDKWWWQG